jgi:hypothetical protein
MIFAVVDHSVEVPLNTTDQLVPLGSPTSLNVTENLGSPFVNVMVSLTAAPATGTVPADGLAEYPVIVPIEKGQVPFLDENAMLLEVLYWVVPLNVTDHVVPAARPTSLNVTE